MSKTVSAEQLFDLVRRSGLAEESRLEPFFRGRAAGQTDTKTIVASLIKGGVLTPFQADCLLAGRYKGFILGAYKILDRLGQGGMGIVYLAEHVSLNRKVAIKVLTPNSADDPLAMERFYREARSAASLDHPNIVRVYDVTSTGPTHYIVMEYIEGETLRALLDRQGPLHYAQAADYIAQAAAGLQQAYEKSLVHRDIKPENLILDKTGTVKILDMGLARQHEENKQSLTEQHEPNAILGTPDYIAPEQAINGCEVDIRADIYSLGATFYALVSGKPPFSGNTVQKLTQHQLHDPPSLSKVRRNVPARLSEIVSQMMAKRPEDRFQTPMEVIDVLAPWLHGGSDSSTSSASLAKGLPASLSRSMSKTSVKLAGPRGKKMGGDSKKKLWIAGGVGVTVLGVVLAVALSGGKKKPETAGNNEQKPPVTQTTNQQSGTVNAPPKSSPKTTTIYTLDLSGVKPFSLTMKERNATDTHARGQLPSPWIADVHFPRNYKGIPTSEFTVNVVDGMKVISLKNIEGSFGQFITGSRIGQIKVGNTYTFRVEYRTTGQTRGEIGVRGGVSGLLPTTRFSLSPTDGQWKTTEFILDPTKSIDMLVFIQNLDNEPDNLFELRSFSVSETTP